MKNLIEKALRKVHETVQQFDQEAVEIVKAGEGFGEVKNDIEIRADRTIGTTVLEFFRKDKTPQTVEIEGLKKFTQKNAKILRVVDPLDGSLNFLRRRGTHGLPFCTAIAEFKGVKPYFRDYVAAGLIDLRNGDLWLAEKGNGCTLNGKPCRVSTLRTIDARQGPIIIADFYYPDTRRLLAKILSDFKGYLRNPGSSGYEMALVACGVADVYISSQQKNDSFAAGYSLVKEAGGVAVDFEGKDIADRLYEFEGQTPIIMAATQKLAEEILERVQKSQKKIGKEERDEN